MKNHSNEELKNIILLYDFYSNLITKNQQKIFTEYYFNDLTMNEIAKLFKITRPAVNDSLKKTLKSFEDYESKLNLLKKHQKRLQLLKQEKNLDLLVKKIEELEFS